MEAVREREGTYDRWLFVVTVLLLILGTIAVLDASFARALHAKGGDGGYYFFKRQATWALIALGALGVSMRVPYWKLRDPRIWFCGVAASIFLLLLVLVIGKEINGSKRWLGLGFASFQPSEFAKIALVIFLARYSELWRGRIKNFAKGFLPAMLVVFMVGGLVAKEDLGTAITIMGTGMIMIFMMGARPIHMVGLLGLAPLAGVGFILVEPYRLKRITAWVDLIVHPLAYHGGDAYQPWQGLIALGSAGIRGQGIALGTAKHLYLPAEHTDYIFATIGQELGLFGCLGLLALFALLIIRGLTIAHRTRDWFGSMMVAGFTSMIGLQALLNIAVVTSIVPCTGVPLPFISYGGSSLVFTTLALGIVLNVSQHPNGRVAEARENQASESRADGRWHRRPHLSRT